MNLDKDTSGYIMYNLKIGIPQIFKGRTGLEYKSTLYVDKVYYINKYMAHIEIIN